MISRMQNRVDFTLDSSIPRKVLVTFKIAKKAIRKKSSQIEKSLPCKAGKETQHQINNREIRKSLYKSKKVYLVKRVKQHDGWDDVGGDGSEGDLHGEDLQVGELHGGRPVADGHRRVDVDVHRGHHA